MAGITAGRRGVKVLLLETRRVPGAKIRVSGGGRCNLLPSVMTLDDYQSSGSKNTLRNILFSWPLPQVRDFFESELSLKLKLESTGKLFPVSDDSKDVVDVLLKAVSDAGCVLKGDSRVTHIACNTDVARFCLTLHDASQIYAHSILMCTGGMSMPKTGSDGAGWRMLHKMGHTVLPTHPALVALSGNEKHWHELAGISLPVTLTAHLNDKPVGLTRGDFLFTHHGYSGPAVLDISGHFTRSQEPATQLRACWGADTPDWSHALAHAKKGVTVGSLLRAHLPRRLISTLCHLAAVAEDATPGALSKKQRQDLLQMLTACPLSVTGSDGYKSAEITGGGVPLSEIETSTLMSKKIPGLYLAGEVLDVKGRIGGFNFLWAFVSGRRVGLAIGSGD